VTHAILRYGDSRKLQKFTLQNLRYDDARNFPGKSLRYKSLRYRLYVTVTHARNFPGKSLRYRSLRYRIYVTVTHASYGDSRKPRLFGNGTMTASKDMQKYWEPIGCFFFGDEKLIAKNFFLQDGFFFWSRIVIFCISLKQSFFFLKSQKTIEKHNEF